MSTNCFFGTKVKKNFDSFFDKSFIARLGKLSGFNLRKPKKIKPYDFVLGFLLSCLNKQNTFSGWAQQISLLTGQNVSKQAVFDRMGTGAVDFAIQLLQRYLLTQSFKNIPSSLFTAFGKVLLQDSTTLKLHQLLSLIFPGSRNGGDQNAIARIQSIIDIKSMRFIDFVLSSFTQNDQSSSGSILKYVKKGDLVIRDMGYFAMDTFAQLIDKGVHFLSRLKYGVKLYDLEGKELSLKALYKGNKTIDRWVYIGADQKVIVRLIMVPVPKPQKAERVRKAKNDRDKRLNHTDDYYKWLGYAVHITTVQENVWTPTEVLQAYGVRWKIEIIFKSWKTGFHLQEMLHEGYKNEYRVRVSIWLMLLFICMFMQKIFLKYNDKIEQKTGKQISLLKLANYVWCNMMMMMTLTDKKIQELITRNCCYDKRPDRVNMTELYKN